MTDVIKDTTRGETTAPATPAGVGKLANLFKKRKIRQQNVPYLGQFSVQPTQKIYLGVQKAPGGDKKA